MSVGADNSHFTLDQLFKMAFAVVGNEATLSVTGGTGGGGGTTGGSLEATQLLVRANLVAIQTALDLDKDDGVTSTKTLRVILDKAYRDNKLIATWTDTPGNNKEFTYYAANEAGNASPVKQPKEIILKDSGAVVVHRHTFTWDADGDALTHITANA